MTAVLVAGDSPARTREVRAALETSTARPGSLVEVAAGARPVGAAVDAALGPTAPDQVAGGRPVRWLWLLHDDAVPDPTALEALLACADAHPDAGLVGPATVDGGTPRRLVELGVTLDLAGRRRTGVEPDEHDQGQHDAVREVLAVSTAGALVRREVWDALGGLDPALPPGCDDLDLGWRVHAAGHQVLVAPRARVRRRVALAGAGRSALVVPLLHAGRGRLPLVLLRSVLGVVLRALGLLLIRRPAGAAAELAALGALAHPRQLHAGRRRRTATRTAPPAQVHALLVRRRTWLRAGLLDTAERLAGAAARPTSGRRPGPGAALVAGLVAGLAAVTLLAERSLLGAGRLAGGALLPPAASAAHVSRVVGSQVVGSQVVGSQVVGSQVVASQLVELLLLTSVPLAGASAWVAAGRVVRVPLLRAWLAAAWALLPAVTGTVGDGRLDLAVLAAALPLLLAVGWSVLADDPRDDGWRRTWALALVLLLVGAVAPQVWRAAVVVLLVPAVLVTAFAPPAARAAARRRLAACATALVVPALVLLPEPVGGTASAAGGPSVVQLLLAPGPADLRPAVLWAGVLVAGLVALLRTGRPRLALGGWGLALVGLVPVLVDPATGVLLVHAGVLVAAAAGADGLAQWLGQASFGRRQLGALVVGAAAALAPVLGAAAWVVDGADGPVERRSPVALPAFVQAELESSGTRSLLLRPRPDGAVGWALAGPRSGERAAPALQRAVGDLLAGGESGAATVLGRHGVAWVALAGPRPAPVGDLVAALDAEPGLSRASADALVLWRTTTAVVRPASEPPAHGRTAVRVLALGVLLVLAGAPDRRRDREAVA